MPVPVDPYNFTNGTVADAEQVDARFSPLYAALNAAVDQTNLKAGALGLAEGCFSAYQSNGQTVTAAVDLVLSFGTEEWDVSSWFDAATGRFTPQRAGYYRLSAAWEAATSVAAGTYFATKLRKNGAVVKIAALTTSSNDVGPVATALVSANGTTDYFDVAAYCAAATSTRATAIATYFQGEMVGRS